MSRNNAFGGEALCQRHMRLLDLRKLPQLLQCHHLSPIISCTQMRSRLLLLSHSIVRIRVRKELLDFLTFETIRHK